MIKEADTDGNGTIDCECFPDFFQAWRREHMNLHTSIDQEFVHLMTNNWYSVDKIAGPQNQATEFSISRLKEIIWYYLLSILLPNLDSLQRLLLRSRSAWYQGVKGWDSSNINHGWQNRTTHHS
jgi:hypothetical protein